MRPASFLLVATLLSGTAREADLTAVLSQVEGNVTVKEKTSAATSRSPIRQARFLQTVRMGDEIRVSADAGARLVCSNDREVPLPKAKEIRFTKELCLHGTRLPLGTYRKLAPTGGRLLSVKGWNVFERSTRGEGEGFGVPILLSPRNTWLLDARPEIVWTPVRDATEYEIELVGPQPFRYRIDASKLSCNRDGWGEAGVCAIPWPEKAPDVPSIEGAFLSVGARRGLASPLRKEENSHWVRRLTGEPAEQLRSSLKEFEDLPLPCEARRLLEADLYARAELLSEAIVAYRKALSLRDVPEIRITLGDVYFASNLHVLADQSYRAALAGSPEPAVRAGAEFGLGRIEHARGSFDRAREHFRKARDLYAKLGLTEESSAARSWMDRSPQKSGGE